jgi:hypothetical protein
MPFRVLTYLYLCILSHQYLLKSNVFMAVTMLMIFFWIKSPSSAMKMETACFSVTLTSTNQHTEWPNPKQYHYYLLKFSLLMFRVSLFPFAWVVMLRLPRIDFNNVMMQRTKHKGLLTVQIKGSKWVCSKAGDVHGENFAWQCLLPDLQK